MSIEQNKALSSRYISEMHNQKNPALADEVFAGDAVIHLAGTSVSREGYKQLTIKFFAAFPDLHVTVEDQIAEGDRVATRWTTRGTETGTLDGIGPTNKPATVTGICIDRIAAGQIVETWMNYDEMGLLEQLGVIPPRGPAGR
jgi:predicted ester cyclase